MGKKYQFRLLLLAFILNIHGCSNSERAPYPQSELITDVILNWNTEIRLAPGSDNWPTTWAADNSIITSWGDGGGFGGCNHGKECGRVSLGFAKIVGSNSELVETCGDPQKNAMNIWGGKCSKNPNQFAGKSYGIISINGILYAWWGPGSNTESYSETRLLMSTDSGATWNKSTWDLTDTDHTLIMPTILNFGKDYADNRKDGFVYHYFIRKDGNPKSLGIHEQGYIDLARVPIKDIMDSSKYEYFAGFEIDAGTPRWTSKAENRQPVFRDPNGVGWNVAVSHNKSLDRYILTTEHSASNKGKLGIFEANEPWGPWHTVKYFQRFGRYDKGFYWNIPTKWISGDGKNFILLFTGTGVLDSYNSVQGAFTLSSKP